MSSNNVLWNYNLTIVDQSMSILADFGGSYQGLSDLLVPPRHSHTIQCDPWCSAAMNRQVYSSDLTPWNSHAKCGVTPPSLENSKCYMSMMCSQNPSFVIPPLTSKALPNHHPHAICPVVNSRGFVPLKSATTTEDLVGASKTDDPTRSQVRTMRLGWSSSFASVRKPSDTGLSIPEECLPIPEERLPISEESLHIPDDDGFPVRAPGLGFASHGNAEQENIFGRDSNAGRWPYEYLLPNSEPSAKDEQLQGIQLGGASVDCDEGLGTLPWNGSTTSSYPQLPLLKDDGHPLGLDEFDGSALKGHRVLKAEQRPSKHYVPFEYLPACRSSPRRKRRRFTNSEKAVINYKRKMGVCADCRQAKRRASLIMKSVFFC